MSGTSLWHLAQLSKIRNRGHEDGATAPGGECNLRIFFLLWVLAEEEWILMRLGSTRLDM